MSEDISIPKAALCSSIMSEERSLPSAPDPVAPLIAAAVDVELTPRATGAAPMPSLPRNVLEWFRREEAPLLPTSWGHLICRDWHVRRFAPSVPRPNIDAAQPEPNPTIPRGRLELIFSVHPSSAQAVNREIFVAEAERLIRTFVQNEFALRDSAVLGISSIVVVCDPGLVRSPHPYTMSKFPGSPPIMLGYTEDWSVKTCCLTGEHFYPAAPLGFFYEGNSSKPVVPHIALERGFTMSSELVRALARRLNTTDNLQNMGLEIWMVEQHDDNYAGPSLMEVRMARWGGAIDKSYQTFPDEDASAAVARCLDAARDFLSRPEQQEPLR